MEKGPTPRPYWSMIHVAIEIITTIAAAALLANLLNIVDLGWPPAARHAVEGTLDVEKVWIGVVSFFVWIVGALAKKKRDNADALLIAGGASQASLTLCENGPAPRPLLRAAVGAAATLLLLASLALGVAVVDEDSFLLIVSALAGLGLWQVSLTGRAPRLSTLLRDGAAITFLLLVRSDALSDLAIAGDMVRRPSADTRGNDGEPAPLFHRRARRAGAGAARLGAA